MKRLDIGLNEEGFVKLKKLSRIDKVTKRQEENEPMRFYHVTPKRFKIGEFITGGGLNSDQVVCLNDIPLPHPSVARQILIDEKQETYLVTTGVSRKEVDVMKKRHWYCYEVEPQGDLVFGKKVGEIRCDNAAKVIRYVGDPRAMLVKFKAGCEARGGEYLKALDSLHVHNVDNLRSGANRIRLKSKYEKGIV